MTKTLKNIYLICRDDNDIMCFALTKKQCNEDMAKLRAHDKKRLAQLKDRYTSFDTGSISVPAGLSMTVSMGGGNAVRDSQAISEHMDKIEKAKDHIRTTMDVLKSRKYCALKVSQFPHVHAQSNPIFTKQLTSFMLDSTID